jgi:metal-responsive CopG/Arc/MetJ family transcriptional regulator
MADKSKRIHVVLSKELVEAVDELVGHRKRSAFIAAAIEDRLDQRLRLGRALAETAGSLADAVIPEWETPEKTSAWVRKLRAYDNEAFERKLKRWHLSDAESGREGQ